MGILRVVLALAVVLAHSPIGLSPWRPLLDADLAVEVFFVISGFYMGLVLCTKYDATTPAGRKVFWRARFVRIFPAYWIVAVSVPIFWLLFYHVGIKQFLELPPILALWAAVSNVVLLGLDGLLFISADEAGLTIRSSFSEGAGVQPHHLILLAPAWTLSLELMFYLIAPWVVRMRSISLWGVVAASLGVRFALASAGFVDDPWTYRFFPSELVFFVAGVLVHRAYAMGWLNTPLPTAAFIPLLLAFPLLPDVIDVMGRSLWGLAAIAVGAASLPWLFGVTRNWSLDRSIGELSYAVYLIHLPVMMYLRQLVPSLQDPLSFTVATVFLSLAGAYALERHLLPSVLHAWDKRFGKTAALSAEAAE